MTDKRTLNITLNRMNYDRYQLARGRFSGDSWNDTFAKIAAFLDGVCPVCLYGEFVIVRKSGRVEITCAGCGRHLWVGDVHDE